MTLRGEVVACLGEGRGPRLLERWAESSQDDVLTENVHVHAGEGALVRCELPQDDADRVYLGTAAVGLRGGHLVGGWGKGGVRKRGNSWGLMGVCEGEVGDGRG